ncbi:tetratricopeptide repeat protein [Pontibacter harenae]|uniref:tetratricopeptide repeat protein n=1 Tax=Pontibacter harenae TaxID=2894083 RepID=UPI001E38DCEC|nr:tetratricopeptide repeat protein [Pontibacter harenae]MCC9168661.1 tetratricopeptide repeat protein [Pontibacter harenae]
MANNWKYILLMAAAFPAASAFAQSGDAGRRAVELERYQQAKGIYKSQLNSKNADNAYFGLGDVYLRTDKPDSAAYFFNQGIAKNNKSAINYVGLGKLALEQGNKAKAQENFSQALKLSKSKDPYVLTMVAEAYVDAENASQADLNKAVEYLQQAVSRDSKNPLTYIVLGDAYMKLKDAGKAVSNYDMAVTLDDKNAVPFLKRGQIYTSSRNYPVAEEEYNKAIQVDPNYAPAYRDLGELYYFAGQYDKALSTFKKYVDMSEKTPETQAKYASFLFLTKNYDETINVAQEVLKTDPNNTVMNRLLAYSFMEKDQPEQALASIENYFSKIDKSKLIAKDYEYYGKILAKTDRAEEAAANLEKAISMEPTRTEVYTDLANLYIKNEQFDKAIAVYEKKRENAEPAVADFYYIGRIHMMKGDFQAADSTYTKITEANPTYAYAYLWRAQALASQDPETEEGLAKPMYEEFIKLAGNEKDKYKKELVEANTYLGYYYLLHKEKQNAAKHYQEVLTLNPEHEGATEALKQLGVTAQK